MSSTENATALISAVEAFLAQNRIDPGRGVLVGFSGGPDSCAVLLVLSAIRQRRHFPLQAVYVNHNLRDPGELVRETAAAADICSAAGVGISVKEVPPGAIARTARELRIGIEAAARRHRYGLLDERLRELGFAYLATGHQRDDQTETILMRVLQGAMPRGIQAVNGTRIRPLIAVPRAQIELFLEERGIRPVHDPSNRSVRYLRNRLRHDIVPALREQFPSLDSSLVSLAETVSLSDRFIDAEAKRRIVWRRVTGGLETETGAFASASPAIRLRALFQALEAMSERGLVIFRQANRLPYRFLRPVVERDYGAFQKKGRRVTLLEGHGLEMRVQGGILFWGAHIVQSGKRGYLLSVPEDGAASLDVGTFTLAVQWETSDQTSNGAGKRSPDSYIIPGQSLRPPVVVRSRAPGDELSTAAGKKPVKRTLSDLKVSPELRSVVPVVEDADGVAALVAGPFGGVNIGRAEAAGGSSESVRFLRLTVSPSEEH